MRYTLWFVLTAVFGTATSVGADDKTPAKPKPPEPIARLFVQDLKTSSLKWANVWTGEGGKLGIDALATIEGFKALDPAKQKLVQMRESGSLICVGVRDDEDGAFESGWVMVQSGVGYSDHGDHGHWHYKKKPIVVDSRLDKQQGNPAHMYFYDERFFLANDRLNGYTRLDPAMYATNDARKVGKDSPRFLVGGGNHITLAVVADKVGYSCWIDGGGPNKGRVDVTPVTANEKTDPAYSFMLPNGGIHGATTNSGKVFFAPSDGVYWIESDNGLKLKGDQVKVNRIDLGKEDEKPRRTGAFVSHGHHVLFVTGKESQCLVLLNARHAWPKPLYIPLTVQKRTRAVTPVVVTTAEEKAYAFVFHDQIQDTDGEDSLEVIALDPNGDGDCADAKSIKTLKVGKSAVDGHFGHHDIAFD